MTLSKLLFELPGETRLEILHALETAPMTFTDGRMDHSTMVVGDDPGFCRWCRDLYAYYWERASPIPQG